MSDTTATALVDQGVSGSEPAPTATMAKCFAANVAMKVATDALQLWGPAGISSGHFACLV